MVLAGTRSRIVSSSSKTSASLQSARSACCKYRRMPKSFRPKAWTYSPDSGIATSTPCYSVTATTRIGTKYIPRGLAAGVDCVEHTGLAAAPGYPDDILNALHERTAKMSLGPLFWCPTIEGFINYQSLIENPESLDDPKNYDGVPPDIAADTKQSIAHPNLLAYYQITPLRAKTVAHKFKQLQDSGVVMLIGTDSGIPMKFHSQSTWHELDAWVNRLGVDSMTAIRAATYWPAVMMKVDKDYGSISEGKFADIIAVRGDVLHYIDLLERVDLIIKHGKRVK